MEEFFEGFILKYYIVWYFKRNFFGIDLDMVMLNIFCGGGMNKGVVL